MVEAAAQVTSFIWMKRERSFQGAVHFALETATHPFREGFSAFTDEEGNAISSNLITEQVDSVTNRKQRKRLT
jgi:hypothetical protein